ncbi:hypothetical protein ACLK11_16130 [Escherichia coli]
MKLWKRRKCFGRSGGDDAERENTLRGALATSIMGLNALDIETLNNDEHAWDVVVEEFDGYRQIWRKRGVMPMLRR